MLGKPIGITLGAWLGVKAGACELPTGVSWLQLHGAAWLGGIGFTMSLFISGLALEGADAESAKLGLLLGSLLAGVVGTVVLIRACGNASHDPTPTT